MRLKYKVESIETSDHVVTKITPFFVPASSSNLVRQDSHETFTTTEDPYENSLTHIHAPSHDPCKDANKLDSSDLLTESVSQIYLSGSWRQSGKEELSINEDNNISSRDKNNSSSRENQDTRYKLPSVPVSNLTQPALESLDHSNENYLSLNVKNWVNEVEQSYFGGGELHQGDGELAKSWSISDKNTSTS
uniref:Uncharacterized protein n=1 Tax=Clytia hemisphaerica TaxID=252671 RepID=A0A7M6DNB3_9CNID|eukprot:TCONS_00019287-protein